jgi:hypothetical protein
MKSASSDFFDKARRLLSEADIMLEVGLFEAAGRNAYLAGCCAARLAVRGQRQGQPPESETKRLSNNNIAMRRNIGDTDLAIYFTMQSDSICIV